VAEWAERDWLPAPGEGGRAPNEGRAPAVTRDEGFYRALFEENPAIKLLIDPRDGRIVDANQAAETFYGWPREVLRTMRITQINVLTPDEVREEMENARIGRRRYFRFRHRLAEGALRHVEVHTGPVEIDGEQLLLSIIHDVTDRDRLETQLRESQRLEALGRVAGTVAHDFNNMLTVMIAGTDSIARSLDPGSPLATRASDVLYAARRATALTRELLSFSRRQEMRFETVGLGEVVRELHGVVSRLLAPKIAVELDVADALPSVRVDPAQIEQVLINLTLNARDAMRRGGRVTIRCEEALVGPRDTAPVPAGDWVRLSVQDEGEGMRPEVQQRIFEPFFTTKPEGRGTGLGLATVYGVVTQSGGHVTVESEPGVGSRFTLYFPVLRDEDGARAPAATRAAGDLLPELRRPDCRED
jgi:two-component system, cell cycle sensor histidine kinase and response regulator CckA